LDTGRAWLAGAVTLWAAPASATDAAAAALWEKLLGSRFRSSAALIPASMRSFTSCMTPSEMRSGRCVVGQVTQRVFDGAFAGGVAVRDT
jgi:hypothetical protein